VFAVPDGSGDGIPVDVLRVRSALGVLPDLDVIGRFQTGRRERVFDVVAGCRDVDDPCLSLVVTIVIVAVVTVAVVVGLSERCVAFSDPRRPLRPFGFGDATPRKPVAARARVGDGHRGSANLSGIVANAVGPLARATGLGSENGPGEGRPDCENTNDRHDGDDSPRTNGHRPLRVLGVRRRVSESVTGRSSRPVRSRSARSLT